jgi:HEAT repeat protein
MSQITGREPSLALQVTDTGKRRLSLRRLGTLLNVLPPDKVALDAIAEMLRSDDFFVRYNAAKLLSKRADRDSRVLMEDALKNGQPRTRATVARHLVGFTWFSAEPLLRHALKDSDPRVRSGAIYALCDIKDLNAYNLMAEALVNEADEVREAAAFGLRETQDAAALPILKLVLQAKDADVRIKGLEALGMCGLPQAMPIVREAMFDPEPSVKYAATLSLLELAGEGWLDELSGIVGRTSGETLEQVLLALFHATNYLKIDMAKSRSADLMLDALETALLDESRAVRMAAVWPLAWMRHNRTPDILKKTYRLEADDEVKAHIVRVSAGLMSTASDEILQDALQHPSDKVRAAARKVQEERQRARGPISFDENAYQGEAFNRSHLTGNIHQ